MKRTLVFTLALAGCTSLPPMVRGPAKPIAAPLFACQAEAWKSLAATAGEMNPQQWWNSVDAVRISMANTVCCLYPDGHSAACPADITYQALDEYQKAQVAARDAAEKAAQPHQTPAQLAPAVKGK